MAMLNNQRYQRVYNILHEIMLNIVKQCYYILIKNNTNNRDDDDYDDDDDDDDIQ